MYKNLIKISTVGMPHDEWLKHRRKSIGGSDASAILGMNTYCSPYTVWADKLGKLPPKEDNEAMRLGRDLEDYVAKRFTEETGKKVRRENNIIINPDYPYAHANVDRMVVGEDAGLECKTTSAMNLKRFKNGEYPENYYCQAVHYLMVTGAKRWYLAVLILGVIMFIVSDAGVCLMMFDGRTEIKMSTVTNIIDGFCEKNKIEISDEAIRNRSDLQYQLRCKRRRIRQHRRSVRLR